MRLFLLVLVCIAGTLGAESAFATASFHSSDLAIALQSGDIRVRKAALETFERKVNREIGPGVVTVSQSSIEEISDAMPMLQRALQDTDANVRSAALGCLLPISVRERATQRSSRAGMFHLAENVTLQQTLVALMSDVDADTVRAPATWIYSHLFEPTPLIEQRWMANFSPENENEARAILSGLLDRSNPSFEAIQFAIQKIADPKAARTALAAIIAYLHPPPVEALPIIVQQFGHSDRPADRGFFAQALPKFGESATAYTALLRDLLRKETDSSVRREMIDALSKLGQNVGANGSSNGSGNDRTTANEVVTNKGESVATNDHSRSTDIADAPRLASRQAMLGAFAIVGFLAVAVGICCARSKSTKP